MSEFSSRLLQLQSAPSVEPLILAETKLFLRVDGSTEDTLITDLIVAARQLAEEYLRRSLVQQSWKLVFDDAAPVETLLPRRPIISITSVTSIARDGTQTTIDSDIYYLNAAKDSLVFDAQVTGHQVEVIYAAGYGNAADVPGAIRQGLLNHVAALYDGRVFGREIPGITRALYDSYREVML